MPDTTTVPLTVTPEAEALITEQGMQEPFAQIVEYARKTLPGLRALAAEVALPYDMGIDPGILIWATQDRHCIGDTLSPPEFREWIIRTFPASVRLFFSMICLEDESTDAR